MITRVYKWRNDHEILMVYCFYSKASAALRPRPTPK